MTICYLFAEQLDESGILSLCLDNQGQVNALLAVRSVEEIKSLQTDAKTVVVLPAEISTLHEVDLPRLPERKARAAIPYALEEQLAQNVSSLHFSFDKRYYHDNRYLTVVVDKAYLSDLTDKLSEWAIHYDDITLDWFALKEGESCLTAHSLLVHENQFKGALTGELINSFLKAHYASCTLLTFRDSLKLSETLETTPAANESAFCWIAKRLQESHPLSLCQGDFQKSQNQGTLRFWYQLAAVFAGVLLISFIIMSLLNLYFLNKVLIETDDKIAVIYREFFPQARQVISPKFRVEQALKSGKAQQEEVFWILLDIINKTFNSRLITIDQMRFQNQTLTVILHAQDFATLERLQQQLQKGNVLVNQLQASSQNGMVLATLELSL